MNRNLLIAGGIVLLAGGLAYWYIGQAGAQPPNGPPPNGPPPNDHGCIGECFYKGATDCDRNNNLCICIDGQWQLLERNSLKCIIGESHLECFPSQNDIITCIPTPGAGSDICTNPGYSTGCSCVSAQCDIFHFCEPRDYKCVKLAENYLVYAVNETSSHWLGIPLEEPLAATTILTGRIWYKWAGLIDIINWSIWGRYAGVDSLLCDGWYSSSGGEGWFDVPLPVFTPQGIETLKVHCDSAFSNVIPAKFEGKLQY